MKRTIKQYLREVKKHLVASPIEKMAMIADLKGHLYESYGEESELTLETLYENVGKPEKTAKSFFVTRDLSKVRKRTKRNAIIAITACVLALVIAGVGMYFAFNTNPNNTILTNYHDKI